MDPETELVTFPFEASQQVVLADMELARPEQFFAPVWDLLSSTVWLAGGAVTRWLEGTSINTGDFDLFTSDPHALWAKLSGEAGEERCSHLAWTFLTQGHQRVQVVKRPYLGLEETLRSFDFTARMAGIAPEKGGPMKRLVVGSTTIGDILDRTIRYHSGNFSLSVTSLESISRYANRGYKLSHEEARKFLSAWGVHVDMVANTLSY